MLMEGIVLYVLLIKVFVEGLQKKYIIRFTLLSYGKKNNTNFHAAYTASSTIDQESGCLHNFLCIYPGLPAVYMCITVPMGFLLNGQWHYGSDEMSVH